MKTVLITGGSGGIGLELSKLFAKDGYNLVIVAKFEEELAKAEAVLKKMFPNINIITWQQDLTEDGAAQRVLNFTKEKNIQVDVLVNNAGFGSYGYINEVDFERESNMIRLNVLCVYQMTRLFMKEMVARDAGKILNISSITAFQPSPFFSTYAATKSFVKNFSRAINHELKSKKSKVRVTVACPTSVKTQFQQESNMGGMKLFDGWMAVSPELVAKDAYAAMNSSKDMVIPNKFFHYLNEFSKRLPTRFLMNIAESQLK
ncbi:MAG: SDR family NAD(P)-dependent oxidoreductase [Saprospiraceae bacterium]